MQKHKVDAATFASPFSDKYKSDARASKSPSDSEDAIAQQHVSLSLRESRRLSGGEGLSVE